MVQKSTWKPLIWLAVWGLFVPSVWAEDTRALALKGAYLYNFTKFVYWPNEKQSFVDLCIWGDEPLRLVMNRMLKGKKARGRSVRIFGASHKGATCDLLYLGMQWQGDQNSLQALNRKGRLTASPHPEFFQWGGMVQLITHKNKLRFRIHQAHAEAQSVKFNSKLMQLALDVVR
ncbi:YfiR family protein [Magnetococcus sp. PR-3]|uniref:YfiR family protein n=1 Tax=Magnetococcus sp. PR-3 TaxID=3120355 RepID=UPI002FCE2DD7